MTRVLIAVLLLCLSGCVGTTQRFQRTAGAGFDWHTLPANTWVMLPTSGHAPAKVFHGGMTLDTDRGLLLVFGSDSHRRATAYDNAVYRLDLRTLHWSRDYPADAVSDYVIDRSGIARTTHGRPWGEHIFGTIAYVPPLRQMVITQFPEHAFLLYETLGLDKQRIRPATWLYDPDAKRWHMLTSPTPNLFAKAIAYDPDTHQLVGCDGAGSTWIFDPGAKLWTQYNTPDSPMGWNLALEYDTRLRRILAYGNMQTENVLRAFDVRTKRWERITTGISPPGGNGAALAYATKTQALIFLASAAQSTYSNTTGESETWVFESAQQVWMRLNVNSPPLYGMNYYNVYDPARDVVLFGERGVGVGPEGGPLAIWAFRYVNNR